MYACVRHTALWLVPHCEIHSASNARCSPCTHACSQLPWTLSFWTTWGSWKNCKRCYPILQSWGVWFWSHKTATLPGPQKCGVGVWKSGRCRSRSSILCMPGSVYPCKRAIFLWGRRPSIQAVNNDGYSGIHNTYPLVLVLYNAESL